MKNPLKIWLTSNAPFNMYEVCCNTIDCCLMNDKNSVSEKLTSDKKVAFFDFRNGANKHVLLSAVFVVSFFYYACGQQSSQPVAQPTNADEQNMEQSEVIVEENTIPASESNSINENISENSGESAVMPEYFQQEVDVSQKINGNIESNGLFSYYVTGNPDEDSQNYKSAKQSFLENNPELTDYVNRLEEAHKAGKHLIDKNEFENMPKEKQRHILKNKDKYLIK
jgi:hypothetical protein